MGICTALADHTLNKHCAYGLRADMYDKHGCATFLAGKPSASPLYNEAGVEKPEPNRSDRQGGSRGSDGQNSFAYHLYQDGCDTGSHKFTSRTQLCEGLENEANNNFCAREKRREMFEANDCGHI